MTPPVQTMTLELQIDRGEEEVFLHRFAIDFKEPPTPEAAKPYIEQIFELAIARAMEAVAS